MKKRLLQMTIVVCIVAFVFVLMQGAALAKVTLKLGHIRAEDHPTHKAALYFKKLVEESSRGNIEIKVYPNSQLGGPKEMFSQLQIGALEMVYGGINTFAWIKGGEAYEITAIPFLYKSYEDMKRVLTSDVFKPITEKAEKDTKIKVLNINGDTPPRGLTTKDRPVWEAADFKGLKIRTAASPTVMGAMKKLGALPQQVPFSELYMALKTGVVDAQENGSIVVKTNSLYEVQKYYMKTDYIRDIETFYVGMQTWDKLSEADKKILYEASEKAGDYETKLTQEQIESSINFLTAKMRVIIPNNQSIQLALEGVFEPMFEGIKWPKGLLQKVRDMQK
jgi:tripartite ATP-independent transporter DctP family solute receptor